jgi:hypothetical protein
MMGDTVHGASADFTVKVIGKGAGPEPMILVISKNGIPFNFIPVLSTDFSYGFHEDAPDGGTDHYGVEVLRGAGLEDYATPIFLTREPAPVVVPLSVAAPGARRIGVHGGRLLVRCRAAGDGLNGCSVRVRRYIGHAVRTIGTGHVGMSAAATHSVPVHLTKTGAQLLRRHGKLGVTLEATASDSTGHDVRRRRTATLIRR